MISIFLLGSHIVQSLLYVKIVYLYISSLLFYIWCCDYAGIC